MKKYEKLKLIGLVIKAVTGVFGTATIMEAQHPYLAVTILAIGAGANEFISYLKDKEFKNGGKPNEPTP